MHGCVVDPAYSWLLIQKADLPLFAILALVRVQKKLPISAEMTRKLRRDGLIEGRKPNIHVSAAVAKATAHKAEYIKTRAQSDDFYCKLITDYLSEFGEASRSDIDELLLDSLSKALSSDQKKKKVANLLSRLRNAGIIRNKGIRSKSKWVLVN